MANQRYTTIAHDEHGWYATLNDASGAVTEASGEKHQSPDAAYRDAMAWANSEGIDWKALGEHGKFKD